MMSEERFFRCRYCDRFIHPAMDHRAGGDVVQMWIDGEGGANWCLDDHDQIVEHQPKEGCEICGNQLNQWDEQTSLEVGIFLCCFVHCQLICDACALEWGDEYGWTEMADMDKECPINWDLATAPAVEQTIEGLRQLERELRQ